MSAIIRLASLEQACKDRLPDEEVLAVGMFEPYGSMLAASGGAGVGDSLMHLASNNVLLDGIGAVAGTLAAEKGVAMAEHQPKFSALAATATRIVAFDATGRTGATATTNLGEIYHSWDRAAVAVHLSRYLTSFTLTIHDPADGTTFSYHGNKIYKVGGKLLAHLLVDDQDGDGPDDAGD